MESEPYRLSPDPTPEPAPAEDAAPFKWQILTNQTDPELRAIDGILFILESLPHVDRARALAYVKERTQSDPRITPGAAQAARDDVAAALAESDGVDWERLGHENRSVYYRCADGLTDKGLIVIRLQQ